MTERLYRYRYPTGGTTTFYRSVEDLNDDGWGEQDAVLESAEWSDRAALTETVTRIDLAIFANEDGGEYVWKNSEVLELLATLREPYEAVGAVWHPVAVGVQTEEKTE